jgi:AraC family transcriptional activator of pobA
MNQQESLQEYYRRRPSAAPVTGPLDNAGGGHFNVFYRSGIFPAGPFCRRDFYNVCLTLHPGTLQYAHQKISVTKPSLVFCNPQVPYAWKPEANKQEGWFCLFTNELLLSAMPVSAIPDFLLHQMGESQVYELNEEDLTEVKHLFEQMGNLIVSDYAYKYDLLLNYLCIIVHKAAHLQQLKHLAPVISAAQRTAKSFMQLLNEQFPITDPVSLLELKTADDFASRLSVHVNHLNRSLKEATGKTTTEHIARRIIAEAVALLKHTDWNIAQIAYCLNFEEPSYFTKFFKRYTQKTPMEIRLCSV